MSNPKPQQQTKATLQPPYRVESTSALQAGHELLALWAQSGLDLSLSKYNWYYRNNPLVAPTVLLLKAGTTGQTVGTCSLGYRQMVLGQQVILAANRCDLTVLPEHRGTLAAPTLLNGVRETGLRDADMVYGLPNALAQSVVSRSGFQQIGKLYNYSKVLDLNGYVRNKIPATYRKLTKGWLPLMGSLWRGWQAAHRETSSALQCRPTRIDERFDRLWRQQPHPSWLIGVRDQAFLRWRFDPAYHPHIQMLGLFDSRGDLHGYAAVSHHQGHTQVHDFFAKADAEMSTLRQLLEGVFDHALQNRSSTVHVQFFGSSVITDVFKSMGMRRRGGHPILAAGRLTEQVFGNQFYMTWADTDV